MIKIKKCPKCKGYTLKDVCPKCGVETISPHPPKFSLEKEMKIVKYKM